jgi:hypothetical protein
MKTYFKNFLLVAVLLLTLPSCESFLETQPREAVPGDIALNTVTKFESAIAGAYGTLTQQSHYGEYLHTQGELMADNIDISVAFAGDPVANRSTNIFTQVNRDIWANSYTCIRNCNILLDALDRNIEIVGATQALRNQWRGECLALRALMHFELVRLWGRPFSSGSGSGLGVPIRNKVLSANEAFDRTPRSTVAAVYTQVLSDLNAALPLLPTTHPSNARLTTWAVRGLLARVYFNQNDYANAYAQANNVITNGGFSLINTRDTAAFRNSGTAAPLGGVVWQVAFDGVPGVSGTRAVSQRFVLSSGASGLDGAITSLANDSRNSDTFRVVSSTRPFSRKWSVLSTFNIPVVRLGELHLIRGESGAQAGVSQTAAAQASLDAIRRQYYNGAAPYTPTTLTGASLISAIQAERRVEMALELADRYHDLRRRQQPVRGLAYDAAALLLKIPDTETGANPDIIQN